MRSKIVKVNHFSSAVSDILWYTRTDTHTQTHTHPVTFIYGYHNTVEIDKL